MGKEGEGKRERRVGEIGREGEEGRGGSVRTSSFAIHVSHAAAMRAANTIGHSPKCGI